MASSPMQHCAHELPLGVTPEVLQRCLPKTSNQPLANDRSKQHQYITKGNQPSPPPIAFDINHDADPQRNEHHAYEYKKDSGEYKEEAFVSTNDNVIYWYQYLVPNSYVTFTANASWDIECQWIAKEAETNSKYKFIVDGRSVDLSEMTVVDAGKTYDLKRTRTLIGRLSNDGLIDFQLSQDMKRTFVYDRNTSEKDIRIGDSVVFEVIWLEPGHMVAFNVRLDTSDITDCDVPRLADEFKGQRVGGVVLSLTNDRKKGIIVSYPYSDKPEEHLTLMYCGEPLSVDMRVECYIGLNPNVSECGDYGLFKYVALDVIKKNWNVSHQLFTQEILRPFRGVILVAPTPKGDGFIYNECDNNMCTLLYDMTHEYNVGMYVSYNEIYRIEKMRNDYVAKDVLTIDKVDRNTMNTYVLGSALDINTQENIEFKYAKTNGNILCDEKSKGHTHQKLPKKHHTATDTLRYTTPAMNVKPMPPDTESGRVELRKRLQLKLDEMLVIPYYMDSVELAHIVRLASTSFYAAKKEAWERLVKLERLSVRQNAQQKRKETLSKVTQQKQSHTIVTRRDISQSNKTGYISTGAAVLSSTTTRHPKSLFLEWAQKAGAAAPKASFTDIFDASRNMRIWTCTLAYMDEIIQHRSSKKKAAETKCFADLIKLVMNKYNMISLS